MVNWYPPNSPNQPFTPGNGTPNLAGHATSSGKSACKKGGQCKMAKRKQVVIHEDDVGMTHGSNTAFVELSEIGTCSSGSVMVPCPWFPEAAEIARANPTLDLGVHLTLTSEQVRYRWRPLTAPPPSAGLSDESGYFWPDVPRARKADPKVVEAEMRAQIEMALAAGIDATHLDAHMGTAQTPEFVAIYRRLGHEFGLPALLVKNLSRYNPTTYAGPLDPADYDAEVAAAERPTSQSSRSSSRRHGTEQPTPRLPIGRSLPTFPTD